MELAFCGEFKQIWVFNHLTIFCKFYRNSRKLNHFWCFLIRNIFDHSRQIIGGQILQAFKLENVRWSEISIFMFKFFILSCDLEFFHTVCIIHYYNAWANCLGNLSENCVRTLLLVYPTLIRLMIVWIPRNGHILEFNRDVCLALGCPCYVIIT